MNLYLIAALILVLMLPLGSVVNGQIADLSSNSTNSNMTTTETETETEIMPDPPVEGEQVPEGPNDLEWIPIIADSWDENGLHGETLYHNSKTGETLKPLPYKNGLPLCHDPLYDAGVLGNSCYDELDHDACEPGYIDRGNGCVREVECSSKPGSGGLPFPSDKRTECEKIDYDNCKQVGFSSSDFCDNLHEQFHDELCSGFNSRKECDEASLEINATISDILRLILTEVTGTDRLLLISELENLLENLTANQFEINIELEDNEDGTEKIMTITTTSTLAEAEIPTEEPEETEEPEAEGDDIGSSGNDDSDNGSSDDGSEDTETEGQGGTTEEQGEQGQEPGPVGNIPDVPFG
jgi:hypothetical protein